MAKTESKPQRGRASFVKDKRRRHHHFLVTIQYADGEKFGRVYTSKDKADRFADEELGHGGENLSRSAYGAEKRSDWQS